MGEWSGGWERLLDTLRKRKYLMAGVTMRCLNSIQCFSLQKHKVFFYDWCKFHSYPFLPFSQQIQFARGMVDERISFRYPVAFKNWMMGILIVSAIWILNCTASRSLSDYYLAINILTAWCQSLPLGGCETIKT